MVYRQSTSLGLVVEGPNKNVGFIIENRSISLDRFGREYAASNLTVVPPTTDK
jgi:hypothetical protein